MNPAELPVGVFRLATAPIATCFDQVFGSVLYTNPVLCAAAVFSKSYCPYCNSTKKLLNETGAKFYTIELDQVDDGNDIQAALQEISGQRTVPNIFIGKKHIGGNSDLQAKKGELKSLLTAAGAL